MRSHRAQISDQYPLERHHLNLIPDGWQLQRTPPNKIPSSQSACPAGEATIKQEFDSQCVPLDDDLAGQDDAAWPSVKEERKLYSSLGTTSASAKMGNANLDAFIQGMQGYQWTDVDLEFVYQARQQKQVQQLQQELSDIEKTLQAETHRLELEVASRDQLRSELSKTPCCDSLLQLCKSLLSRSRTSDQLEGLGYKALLSLLNLQDVQQAVHEEKSQVGRLERDALELRDKEDSAKEEMDAYQKKISTLQGNIHALKVELVQLKTQLLEKEESSKAAQRQREVCKAKVISDALEETETEIPEVSQVPAKGRKAPRRVRPATKTLKETVLRETSEMETALLKKAGKGKADEGKTAPNEKAPRKTTSKKSAKKYTSPEKMAPTETPLQVKTPVEMDQEKMSPKVKFSNVAEVHKKGRQGSKTTKKSSTTPMEKAQKKTSLKEPKENEMIPMVTADKELAKEGKSTPKKKTSLKKDLVPDKTDAKELALKEPPPKVNDSNVAQVLKKGRKGSQMAEPSTRTLRERTAMRKTGKKETVEIEADKKSKASRKVNAPKKVTAKNTPEKKMAPDVTFSTIKDDVVLKETVSTLQAQEMMTLNTNNMEMALQETPLGAPVGTPLEGKLKDAKKMVSKKIADLEMPTELTVEAATVTKKTTLKVRAPKKRTLKQKEAKETTRQETDDDDALNETVLKKGLKEATKKKTTRKNKIKEETDSEATNSEKKVTEDTTTMKTAQKKWAPKVKIPKETPDQETALKETRKRASKENTTKQKAGKKPREDEASPNTAQAPEEGHKAVNSPKSPVESDTGIRRSKRNAVKSLSNAIPEKTTRSRRR